MQLDLMQNDLFSTDEPQPATAKIEQHVHYEDSSLNTLPNSILSALRQPADAVFIDDDPHTYQLVDEEIAYHSKSPSAFKTISEASQILDVPQHVLRFWEGRFSQIKPIKSRGGRRYYRPEDMKTLIAIKDLLYKQGYTIKGARKAFASYKKTDIQSVPMSAQSVGSLMLGRVLAQIPGRKSLSSQQISQLAVLRNELANLRDTLKLHM